LIGFFVNTLVLRSEVEHNLSFEAFVKRVENTTLSAYEHQDVPFEQLVEYLQVTRELNRNPLFQVLFNLQHEGAKFCLGDLEVQPEETSDSLSRFDLLINAFAGADGLYMKFDYAKELFSQERMERLADYYEVFLRALLKEPYKRLSEIPLLGEQERRQLSLWNETQHDYPKDKGIHQLFEEQVEKTPSNIAVVYEDQQLTYQELNERANQLAHYLRMRGVGPEKLVAIAFERSLEMVIGIFGVLKAGERMFLLILLIHKNVFSLC
jgi:non-ribosomal peptide synthetase component F